VKQRRALARIPFDYPDCRAIIRRMRPVVEAGPPGPELPARTSISAEAPLSHPGGANRCVTIVARDSSFSDAVLEAALRRLGLATWKRLSADVTLAEANHDLFAATKALDWQGAPPHLAVAMDAATSPDEAILVFLKELRSTIGPNTLISVLLLPSSQSKKDYSSVWKSKIAAMADPYLDFEPALRNE
jgi:hypothetical protein